MTQKFKVGDIVTCVDATDVYRIQKGFDYEVASQDGPYIGINLKGTEVTYATYRFKLKEETMTVGNKFKAGDTVRCVDPSGGYALSRGKDYLVQEFLKDILGEWVLLTDDKGNSGNYRADRFLLKAKAYNNPNKQGDNVNKFVETQTTKTVKTVIDGSFTNCARISVKPLHSGSIELVIGADFEHRSASHFRKKSLLDLAKTLTEIAEALED